jgi:hypothetical protein
MMKLLSKTNNITRRLIQALPWSFVLFITSFSYFIDDGIVVETIVFLIGGIFILIDAILPIVPPRYLIVKPSNLFIACLLLVTTLWILFAPHYSMQNGIIVGAIGILVIPAALSGRSINRKSIKLFLSNLFINKSKLKRATAIWAILLVAFLVLEVSMYLLGLGSFETWYAHPTLTNIIKPLFNNSIFYLVAILLWLISGVYLFRRGRP